MKILFLGTGTSQGIPVINSDHPVCESTDKKDKRLRVSIAIKWGTENCVIIDCGPDFRYQMLRAGIRKINAVLFTHEHADHTAGLDDLRPFSFQLGAVPVYGSERVLANLTERFQYIFSDNDKYPGAPSVIQNTIAEHPFMIGNMEFEPISIMHAELPIHGFKFNNCAYLTDVKTIPEIEKKKLSNLDILIISAIREKPHRSHLNLKEALDYIDELKPKKAYITHISHYLGFHNETSKKLPPNVFLAYDELELEV